MQKIRLVTRVPCSHRKGKNSPGPSHQETVEVIASLVLLVIMLCGLTDIDVDQRGTSCILEKHADAAITIFLKNTRNAKQFD